MPTTTPRPLADAKRQAAELTCSSVVVTAAAVQPGDMVVAPGGTYFWAVREVCREVATFPLNGLAKGDEGVRLRGDTVYADGEPFGEIRGWQSLYVPTAGVRVVRS